jgi:ADP-heptose:LPS heptosyltransferase
MNTPIPFSGTSTDAAKHDLIVEFAWQLVIFGSAPIKEEGVAQIQKETRNLAPNHDFFVVTDNLEMLGK